MKLRTSALTCSLLLSGLTSAFLHADERMVLNDDVDEPLKMEIVEPWYRNTVYASMSVDDLKVNLYPSVGINPGHAVGSTLRVQVVAESGEVVAETRHAELPLTFLIRETVPISELSAGRYRVVAEMFNGNGDVLRNVSGKVCKAESRLTIAPSAPHEVVFDTKGICHIDGEPLFPIGMYWGSLVIFKSANTWRADAGLEPLSLEQWYRDIRTMGINFIQDSFEAHHDEDFTDVKERADLMHRVGLRSFNNINIDHEDRIPTMAPSPGLLAWYTFDEPMQFGESYVHETVAARYDRLCKLDPYHPQIAADNAVSSMRLEAPYLDVLMPDVYPQRDGDMRVVGRVVAELKTLKGGRAVVWPVIQAFQISQYSPRPDGSTYSFGRLTYEEMRATVFDAVACGATGIAYYAYYTSEGPQTLPDGSTRPSYLLDDFPDQRQAMTKINQQLNRLVPAILTGQQRPTHLAPHDSDAHVRAFVRDGKCYVLVTYPGRAPVDVRIGVLGVDDQEGRDLYSNTKIAIDTGYFDLILEPLDVFVFAFDL